MNTSLAYTVFDAFYFSQQEWVPNNPNLPVLLFRAAKETDSSAALAELFEASFSKNGWPAQWRAGVYHYHHYHSTAHEALGCFRGNAVLIIGGPGGRKIPVGPGMALVLPAGTGHCCLEANADFQVVGGYPAGQKWDICSTAPSPDMARRIATCPVPDLDPMGGLMGPVISAWKRA